MSTIWDICTNVCVQALHHQCAQAVGCRRAAGLPEILQHARQHFEFCAVAIYTAEQPGQAHAVRPCCDCIMRVKDTMAQLHLRCTALFTTPMQPKTHVPKQREMKARSGAARLACTQPTGHDARLSPLPHPKPHAQRTNNTKSNLVLPSLTTNGCNVLSIPRGCLPSTPTCIRSLHSPTGW